MERNDDVLLSVPDAAKRLGGISKWTVRRMALSGETATNQDWLSDNDR